MARRDAALVADFAMAWDCPSNEKFDEAEELLGQCVFRSWARLVAWFCSGGPNRDYSGSFRGKTSREIARKARWKGEAEGFCHALFVVGLFDVVAPDGTRHAYRSGFEAPADSWYELHDFADNNPHVADTPNRLRDASDASERKGLLSGASRRGDDDLEHLRELPLDQLRDLCESRRLALNRQGTGSNRIEPSSTGLNPLPHPHPHVRHEDPLPHGAGNVDNSVDNPGPPRSAAPGCPANPPHSNCRGCGTSPRQRTARARAPDPEAFAEEVEALAHDQGPAFAGPWPHPDFLAVVRRKVGGWPELCALAQPDRRAAAVLVHSTLAASPWPKARGSPARPRTARRAPATQPREES